MDRPEVIYKAFMGLFFKCLAAVVVNRNITKGWRIVPCRYQGLGLPHMVLEKLAKCLAWLQ